MCGVHMASAPGIGYQETTVCGGTGRSFMGLCQCLKVPVSEASRGATAQKIEHGHPTEQIKATTNGVESSAMTLGESQKEEILEAIKHDEEFKQQIREHVLEKQHTEEDIQEQDQDQKLTRRGFLKTLGLGAGGLALSGLGASRVTITDKGIKKNGNPLLPFSLGSSKLNDNLDVNGNQIKDGAQKIYNPTEQHIPSSVIEQGSGSGLNADQLDGNQASNFATNTDLSSHAGTTAAHHTKYTDSEAANAAPVQSVNSKTGNVSISTGTSLTEVKKQALTASFVIGNK